MIRTISNTSNISSIIWNPATDRMNGGTASDCNVDGTCNENSSITNVISIISGIIKVINTISEIANEAINAVIEFNCTG